MIPLDEAKALIFDSLQALPAVSVSLAEANGLVLAESVTAEEAIPPFDNTAMDGFAVRSSDTQGASTEAPVSLPVVATVAAGTVAPRSLAAGEAMRIMTGAPMPEGADSVIMVELTRIADGGPSPERPEQSERTEQPELVEILASVPVGNHVRSIGDDIGPGSEVMKAGTVLTPGRLGVLASVGRREVRVHPRPRVGVMSTGDELVDGPEPLMPGQIRDSNRPVLLAMVEEAGATPVDLGLQRDDEAQIEQALRTGAASCDVVITSGGVSMGDFDYVKAVLTKVGGFRWMQVAIKPAKPLVFGVLDGTPVFGLPGNPVSSMVSFELFARPALRSLMRHPEIDRPRVKAVAAEPFGLVGDSKTHFDRVVVRGEPGRLLARRSGGQGSHQLFAMSIANGLAVRPSGSDIAAGDEVDVIILDR